MMTGEIADLINMCCVCQKQITNQAKMYEQRIDERKYVGKAVLAIPENRIIVDGCSFCQWLQLKWKKFLTPLQIRFNDLISTIAMMTQS